MPYMCTYEILPLATIAIIYMTNIWVIADIIIN